MKLHEFQAKELFRHYGIPVPAGGVAADTEEACRIAAGLNRFPVALKAQVHAGGRGKGGGIRIVDSAAAVRAAAAGLLGMTLITPQTGAAGLPVRRILVESAAAAAGELYLAVVPDRQTARIILMASAAGGMAIEELTAAAPEKLVRCPVNPLAGIRPYHCRRLADGLGLAAESRKQFTFLVLSLYQLFVERDCLLVEINPLALTGSGEFLALDAKVEIDPNALFRQPEIAASHDPGQEDPLEADAAEHGLSYIRLDGRIGNLVNGAGLAMATMDLIKRAGASPANFLDLGGGASAEMVEHGFRIVLSDSRVRGILINIFGGILRCDILAEGIAAAVRRLQPAVPVVVRMEGTNAEEGRRILAESGLELIPAAGLREAAQLVRQL